ncbi:UDP-N-acetylglucosamine 2-epimerase (non-hydrolyzing) [bacterium K02(2017)]|nr:UDP-N-acetylglucosamine 2-epimerase (non-hydrolyzing) [bacterium K02(2017)]
MSKNTLKKILIVFGTRPEAIKMAPVFHAFKQVHDEFETRVCVTAQHREMLDHVLTLFDIKPDYDLDIMKKGQDLTHITSRILNDMQGVLKDFEPDLVLVQGDTSTAFTTALAAFYHQTKVAHVEAGLRTQNIYSPWPEELNRKLIGSIANIHFPPTAISKNNLVKENINPDNIYITGNTVIDALLKIVNKIEKDKTLRSELDAEFNFLDPKKRMILVTGHRRESFGDGFKSMCQAMKSIVEQFPDVELLYPVHLNPNVQKPVNEILKIKDAEFSNRVHLIQPVEYEKFIYLMNRAYIILSDSGGVQEEAPSLGKPVLVMRDITERPEAVESGCVRLVGTTSKKIFNETKTLLENDDTYLSMSQSNNPFGDGTAAEKIVKVVKDNLYGY